MLYNNCRIMPKTRTEFAIFAQLLKDKILN